MACCNWHVDRIIKRWGDEIASWFSSEDVQSVSVATNEMLDLNTKQLSPIYIMQQMAKINSTSIAKEIVREYTKGKIHRFKRSTMYCGDKYLDGLPTFFVKGLNLTYYNRLKDELLLQSGTGETDRELVQFVVYSDTELPSDEAMGYHYIEHNGYNRDSTNHEDTITKVIDPTTIDFVQDNYEAPDPDLTVSANTQLLPIGVPPLLITDMIILNKYYPFGANHKYIIMQLLDESNGDVWYHELRPVVDASDTLNKIIIVYTVAGYDCCYYYEYQLGSNLIYEFEHKDDETDIDKYGIFTMLPVTTLKVNGEYVFDMKDTANHQRYIDTKHLCSKLGIPLKMVHNLITDKGVTPADESEATTSQTNTKDIFLEFGLNISRYSKETMRALYTTFDKCKDYTTKAKDGNLQAYQYVIKHEDSLNTRYNKAIKIRDIHRESFTGKFIVHTSPTESHTLKKGAYHVEQLLVHWSNHAKESIELDANFPEGSELILRPYEIDTPIHDKDYYLYRYAEVLRCVYQETDTDFTIVDVQSIKVSSVIEDSGNRKGKTLTMLDTWDNIVGVTSTSLIFPLLKESFTHLPFSYKYNIYDQCIHITYFASTITTLSWYERDWFIKFVQVVLVVVSVIIIYFTAGSGTSFSTTLLHIAITIGASYALQWALKQTDNKYLRGILITAYIAVMTVVGTKAGMSTSDITMLLGSNALTASSVMLNVKTEEEQIKYNRFMKELQYSVASLQNEFRRYDRANPDTQFDLDLFLLEDIDEFYKRTVSTDLVTMMGIMEDGVLNYDANNFLNLNLMPL